MVKDFPARFWAKVDKNGPIASGQTTRCWVWTGAKQFNEPDGRGLGHGSTTMNGKPIGPHRASWLLHFGEIHGGLWVLHRCDNRACVNPQHLFLGTAADNTADMVAKGRASGGARNPLHGEDAPWSKLKATQVLEIDAMLKAGVPQGRIALRYGIHRVMVSQIKLRKRWKHLFADVP